MTWPVQRQRHRHLEKHIQRAIQETCSMWWGDKTWQTKKSEGKCSAPTQTDMMVQMCNLEGICKYTTFKKKIRRIPSNAINAGLPNIVIKSSQRHISAF